MTRKCILSIIILIIVSITGMPVRSQVESDIIKEISKFLTDRAKQEAFDCYVSQLKYSKYIKHFFPQSWDFLDNYEINTGNLALLWKKEIRDDFGNIHIHLYSFILKEVDSKDTKYKELIEILSRFKGNNDKKIDELKKALEDQYNENKKKSKNNTQKDTNTVDKNNKSTVNMENSKKIKNIFDILRMFDIDISNYQKKFFWAIAALADANENNKEEITATLLKEFTMPVGSYKIKRETRSSIFLNSYFGLSIFKNCVYEKDNTWYQKLEGRGEWLLSLYVPVGFELSIKPCNPTESIWKNKWYNFWSLPNYSLFLPLFDFGLPARAYLANEDHNFTIKDIISPGIYFIMGIKGYPVSIGTGYDYHLARNNEGVYKGEHRVQFFLGIDMPLYPVYAR